MKTSKQTKRALLGSFTSLLLCFAMLIGSTFAWFTDTASTSVNTIQAGKLDVEIVDENGAALSTLSFKDANDGTNILWEPGATFRTQGFQIKGSADNNLAFKYKIAINGLLGDAELLSAIDFSVVKADSSSNTGYRAIDLADFVGHITKDTATFDTLYLQGHMKEEAGNTYQGKTLTGITVAVYATQDTVEYDSNGKTYDQNAQYLIPFGGEAEAEALPTPNNGVITITSAGQLYTFLNGASVAAGSTVKLDCDVDLGGATVTGYKNHGTLDLHFDGQGHTISNFKIDTSSPAGYYASLFSNVQGGSVKNLTVKNATITGDKNAAVIAGAVNRGSNGSGTVENCHVIDCIVTGTDQVGAVVGFNAGCTVTGCSATNCTIFYSAPNHQDTTGETVGLIGDNDGTATGNTSTNVSHIQGNATLVSTAAELKSALNNYTNGTTVTAVLTNDIDMSGWTALNGGTNHAYFVLCGNGYALKGQTAPLFSSFPAKDFTVKDVTFKNANISTTGDNYAGVIVGEMCSSGGGTYVIENCDIVDSSIKAYKYAGGFIGFAAQPVGGSTGSLTITDCAVTNSTFETEDSSCGSLIGHTWMTTVSISGCSVSGGSVKCTEAASGDAKAGALIGTVSAGTVTFSDCSANTIVTNDAQKTAPVNAFVGRNYGTVSVIS